MCTMIAERASIQGSGKTEKAWISIDSCDIYYDHPDHVDSEHAITLSFSNQLNPINSRISLEITPESAIEIIKKIKAALSKGDSLERQ